MKKQLLRLKREMPLHLMLLPGVVIALIFCYTPMAGLIIAFQKFIPSRGLFGDQTWIGWGNFEYLFLLPDTLQVIGNTVTIAVCKVLGNLLVPICVALLLNELNNAKIKRTIQTIIYFPYFISWVVLGGILIDILSPSTGMFGQLCSLLGINAPFLLGSNNYFWQTMVVSDVWRNFGFGTIVYLASITSIDPCQYEAAEIDGANRWQQTLHVTLPGMQMIIVLMMVLALGNVLNAGFEQIYNLYSPSVYETGDIIDTFIYRLGILNAQFGPASAMGLFKSGISTVLISTAYFISIKFFGYRLF